MSFFFCPHTMVCGFFLSVGNGLCAVPIRPGQKKGNGTQAVPYDVNVYAPFAGIWKSFWCVQRNGRCPFPTLHYLGIAHLAQPNYRLQFVAYKVIMNL